MDPQSKVIAENFIKLLCKLIYTAIVEGKGPARDSTTSYCHIIPHPILPQASHLQSFSSNSKTKHPIIHTAIRDKNDKRGPRPLQQKLQQKLHVDSRCKAKLKEISPGDKVLHKQAKTTTKPAFDLASYKVVDIKGSQVKAVQV